MGCQLELETTSGTTNIATRNSIRLGKGSSSIGSWQWFATTLIADNLIRIEVDETIESLERFVLFLLVDCSLNIFRRDIVVLASLGFYELFEVLHPSSSINLRLIVRIHNFGVLIVRNILQQRRRNIFVVKTDAVLLEKERIDRILNFFFWILGVSASDLVTGSPVECLVVAATVPSITTFGTLLACETATKLAEMGSVFREMRIADITVEIGIHRTVE
jgi:hypothetical protein